MLTAMLKEIDMIVDKLGYYRMRNNGIAKVIHICKKGGFPVLYICTEDIAEIMESCTITGKYHFTTEGHPKDLIEFIGSKLPKRVRKFEFEAWIGENPTRLNERKDPESALDQIFGYSCGRKLVLNKRSYHPHYEHTTKWKVTLEEQPDDSV